MWREIIFTFIVADLFYCWNVVGVKTDGALGSSSSLLFCNLFLNWISCAVGTFGIRFWRIFPIQQKGKIVSLQWSCSVGQEIEKIFWTNSHIYFIALNIYKKIPFIIQKLFFTSKFCHLPFDENLSKSSRNPN